jgi:hypothetical protein
MNIGLGDPKPSFPLLAGTGVRACGFEFRRAQGAIYDVVARTIELYLVKDLAS